MNGAKYIGLHLKLVLVELDVVSVLFARHSLRLFQRLSFHPVLTPAVKFHSCSSQVHCDFMHTGVRFCRLEINWCERSAIDFLVDGWCLPWWWAGGGVGGVRQVWVDRTPGRVKLIILISDHQWLPVKMMKMAMMMITSSLEEPTTSTEVWLSIKRFSCVEHFAGTWWWRWWWCWLWWL